MHKIISCCGCVCSDCEYYENNDCKGCANIKGKAFWLEYTGKEVCDIYACCVNDKCYDHCGTCHHLPCKHYETSDPTKSEEENNEDFQKQMLQLKKMKIEKKV